MVKVAFIGAGKQAHCVHIPNYASCEDCQMVAIADLDGDLAQRVAARFSIPRAYSSHADLLAHEKEIDAFVVTLHATPMAERVVRDIFAIQAPVFVEKPLAWSAQAGERLVAQNTNPRQTPSISTGERDGKTAITIDVNASRFKPVYAFDRPYRRSGRTNQRLSIEDATHIYLGSRGLTWDQTPVEGATLADIDPAAVRRFLQVARTERQWDVRADTPVKQVLRQVGLLVDNRVTVAAILLFGRTPSNSCRKRSFVVVASRVLTPCISWTWTLSKET